MTRLVVATGNRGKVRELSELLADLDLDLVALSDFADAPPVDECADSYVGNARLKAHAAARYTGLPALADDSGLEVDALGGAPGVRSARFAADHDCGDGDADNTALLLRKLEGVGEAERAARFRCAIVLATADGRELVAAGTCEGRIAQRASGAAGFGYDPVFYYPPLQATFAELDPAAKRAVSHRAAACRNLRQQLRGFRLSESRRG